MPGFGLTMGLTLTMVSLVVLLPLGALLFKGATFGAGNIWEVVNRPRTWAALYLSFRLSALAALFNLVFGLLLAWVLVRYRFAGRRLIDAAVDLPFALPTAVAGIALTALGYSRVRDYTIEGGCGRRYWLSPVKGGTGEII